jgi:hypothetical protein
MALLLLMMMMMMMMMMLRGNIAKLTWFAAIDSCDDICF